MEQTRYWTWTRRKLSGMPHIQPFAPMAVRSYDSWEEQAFAEDAAGGLGGCVWPPRSYSCSFCRREFRSAQALGGHMNVHRRDRARLKQSSPTAPVENNRLQHQHHHHHPQYHPCPTQICPVVRSPNPNQDVTASRSLSPSRLTLPSNQENCREHNSVSPSYVSPSIIQENSKHLFFSAPHLRTQAIPELKLGGEDLRLRVTSGKRGWDSCNEEEEILIDRSSKRQKTAQGLPSFLDLEPSDCLRLRIETFERGRSSLEELDLELRLGDRPKVKENCSGSCA